jgi:hypothetical protein
MAGEEKMVSVDNNPDESASERIFGMRSGGKGDCCVTCLERVKVDDEEFLL